MYQFYVLRSQADGKYYYGQTDDIKRRLSQHNSGCVKATSYRRPLVVIYTESYLSRAEAVEREYKVKHNYTVRQKLHERIGLTV